MTDEDFRTALNLGDHYLMSDPPDPGTVAMAQAAYTKALAIATWRAAGQVHLIESSVLEHADDQLRHTSAG